jgi:hypothetical protein
LPVYMRRWQAVLVRKLASPQEQGKSGDNSDM